MRLPVSFFVCFIAIFSRLADAAIAEPTQAAVDRAYRAQVDKINAGAVKFVGAQEAKKLWITVRSVHKTGCQAVSGNSFACTVLVSTIVGGKAANNRPGEVKLTYTGSGSGWELKVLKRPA
jgi:hypothetical protein